MSQLFSTVIETQRPPLGLRFVDTLDGSSVISELIVTAWIIDPAKPQMRPTEPGILARPSASGVFMFPGMRFFDNLPAVSVLPAAPSDPLNLDTLRHELDLKASNPNLLIKVYDKRGRFLPLVLALAAPQSQILTLPLFASPGRTIPAGLGVVRGQLAYQETRQAAAWSLVTVTISGTMYSTLSDERGMFVLSLPYANILPYLAGPPTTVQNGLVWPLSIQIFSNPAQQRFMLALNPPELGSILRQNIAHIVDDLTNTATLTLSQSISFGNDLVVRTAQQAQLLITTS